MISLRIQKLSKSYNGYSVLNAISLEHSEGILGISGANGSGKSTLLKCITGLESINSGSIDWLMDEKPIPQKELKQHLGFSAPYISLYKELSIAENLHFLQKSRPEVTADFDLLLIKVGLNGIGDQLYGSLSTGQQQRAKLAATLFHDPSILILDEPGANLDEKGRTLVEDVVKQSKQRNRLVIIASNNPEELELCDRIFSVQ